MTTSNDGDIEDPLHAFVYGVTPWVVGGAILIIVLIAVLVENN